MKYRLCWLLCWTGLLMGGAALGQDTSVGAKVPVQQHLEKFDVKQVIAKPVADLAEPQQWKGIAGLNLAVFSESEKARMHVQQGFGLIHYSWDFEAYRHFCAALKEDPECLMAYCGIVMALSNPSHEFKQQRARAFNRMLTLVEYKGEGQNEYFYPANERGYALSLAELFVNGLARGAGMFRSQALNYPKDLQARMLAAYFSRGGYHANGEARATQRMALKDMEKLIKQHPENPLPLNFWLISQAEAPYQAVDFAQQMLPRAKQLITLSEGDVPSLHAMLGQIAWRSGELDVAKEAFEKAVALYDAWRVGQKVDYSDCAGLLRAELFLAVVIYEQGEFQQAIERVTRIKQLLSRATRPQSEGAQSLSWSLNLMETKFYLARAAKGDLAQAQKALPAIPQEKSPYQAALQCYHLYLNGLMLAEKGDLVNARKQHGKMAAAISALVKMKNKASQETYFGDYLRSVTSLRVLHLELTSQLTDSKGLSYNWLSSAIDIQTTGSRLLPPDILYPLEYKLGLHYLSEGNKEKARDAFTLALRRRPSHRLSREALAE